MRPRIYAPQPRASHDAGYVAPRLWYRPEALLRTPWVALCLLILLAFGATVPARLEQLEVLAAENRAALVALGLTEDFLGRYILALDSTLMLAGSTIASVILWRRPRGRVPPFVALMLVLYGFYVTRPPDALIAVPADLRRFVDALRALGQVCILAFAYIFPDGRFVPAWTRRLLVLWAGSTLLWLLIPSLPLNTIHLGANGRLSLPAFVTLLAGLGSGGYAQFYRYWRVSTSAQRQQTKWIMLGVLGALAGFVAFQLPAVAVPALQDPGIPRLVYVMAGVPALYTCALLIPLAVGFSVLRYRLWDIDVLINRTLVYGALTASLALVYFACVLMFQLLFGGVAGNVARAPLVVSISTLVSAAFFLPLRRRLQTVIDRRFYRHKYDAARMLAGFGETLHGDIDLATLGGRLVGAIDEAVQPTHVSLWLRQTEGRHRWHVFTGGAQTIQDPQPLESGP